MSPRADWYPDPTNAARLRWWDGHAWTSAIRDALPPPREHPSDEATSSESTRVKRLQILGWALVALGLLMSFIPWAGSESVWTATDIRGWDAYGNAEHGWAPFNPYAVYSNLVGVILLLLLVVAGTAVLLFAKTYEPRSDDALRQKAGSGTPKWRGDDGRRPSGG